MNASVFSTFGGFTYTVRVVVVFGIDSTGFKGDLIVPSASGVSIEKNIANLIPKVSSVFMK